MLNENQKNAILKLIDLRKEMTKEEFFVMLDFIVGNNLIYTYTCPCYTCPKKYDWHDWSASTVSQTISTDANICESDNSYIWEKFK